MRRHLFAIGHSRTIQRVESSCFEYKLRGRSVYRSPGGKVDNGIASGNHFGSDRVIVPVQVIGDQDGMWNKTAWQLKAFYGIH